MLLKLLFAHKTFLSCFFFFFLIIGLYVLIPANIAQIFIHRAELVIPTEILTEESKSEIETLKVSAETKMSKCSI